MASSLPKRIGWAVARIAAEGPDSLLEVGCGPGYAETFVVRRGKVSLLVGDETIEAHEGQIIVVPANVPHGFRNAGPGPLEMIDIHESGTFITEWLD